MHLFDHRWATYGWSAAKQEVETVDVTDAQKTDPAFSVTPRYWVEEGHILARLARVPKYVADAFAEQNEAALLAAFATWIEAAHGDDALSGFSLDSPRQRVLSAGGLRFEGLPVKQDDWLESKALAEAQGWSPLTDDELGHLRSAEPLLLAARTILDGRSPKWLMGWRDIALRSVERTVIASIVPRMAIGHTMPLVFTKANAPLVAAKLGNWSSLVLDYVARQKIGGTHLTYGYLKQFPILSPTAYTEEDLAFIVPRVLELTYTSHDLSAWAADLGYTGAPFCFDLERRARLRAELDAYYAGLYGLTRDELRYILDPVDTHGQDYPTETFRVLKATEIRELGEYRTRRLVLDAWDAMKKDQGPVAVKPVSIPAPKWMDRPLVLPAAPRGTLTADRYRSLLMPHLLYQAGGKIPFDRFRRAYWLLTEPATLQRYATATLGATAKSWAKTFRDKLEKDKFIPHLKGAVVRDLHFIRIDEERALELRRTDHVADDEHAIFDARLALLVADLWPASEPITPLNSQEEAALREMELVS